MVAAQHAARRRRRIGIATALLLCVAVLVGGVAALRGGGGGADRPVAGAAPAASVPGTAAAPAGVTRVFAYQAPPDTEPDAPLARRSLASPLAYGISWKFRWSTLEPAAGRYDWRLVDATLAASAAAGKPAMLRVIAGTYTPEWVYADGARRVSIDSERLENFRSTATTTVLPVPWDPTYLQRWTRFVAAFGARYRDDRRIWSVQMTGGGIIGEMKLPDAGPWASLGYSDAVLTAAWQRIITAYRAAFPTTPTNLDIDEPLRGGGVMAPLVRWTQERYPGRVYLQQNGLKAKYAQRLNQFRRLLREAAATTVVGYQLGDRKIEHGPAAARVAYRVAREDGAGYLEVYASDIADPAYEPALRDLLAGRI